MRRKINTMRMHSVFKIENFMKYLINTLPAKTKDLNNNPKASVITEKNKTNDIGFQDNKMTKLSKKNSKTISNANNMYVSYYNSLILLITNLITNYIFLIGFLLNAQKLIYQNIHYHADQPIPKLLKYQKKLQFANQLAPRKPRRNNLYKSRSNG